MEKENQTTESKDMLTVKEVANLLQMSEATVLRWLRAKKVDGFFRIGRKWLIRKSDFEKFISQKVDEQL